MQLIKTKCFYNTTEEKHFVMAIISNQDCFKSLIQLKINNEAENKKNASKLDAIKTVKNSRYALYNSSLTNNESLKNTNNAKFGSNYAKSYISPQITQAQSIKSINKITDPIIKEALEKLREVKFLSGDLEYLNAMGVNTVYKSGEEAVKGDY